MIFSRTVLSLSVWTTIQPSGSCTSDMSLGLLGDGLSCRQPRGVLLFTAEVVALTAVDVHEERHALVGLDHRPESSRLAVRAADHFEAQGCPDLSDQDDGRGDGANLHRPNGCRSVEHVFGRKSVLPREGRTVG